MDLLVECGICDANVGVWSLILQFCVDLGSKLLPVSKESDQLLLLFFSFFFQEKYCLSLHTCSMIGENK